MNKKRILVIDDEPGFTKLVVLALADYDVRVENDATRAVEAALEFRPDLVFLDVVMPDVDGGEVAAQFRAHDRLERIPIVFLTAIVTQGDVASGTLIGGYPFVAKPTNANRLRAAIVERLGVAPSSNVHHVPRMGT